MLGGEGAMRVRARELGEEAKSCKVYETSEIKCCLRYNKELRFDAVYFTNFVFQTATDRPKLARDSSESLHN